MANKKLTRIYIYLTIILVSLFILLVIIKGQNTEEERADEIEKSAIEGTAPNSVEKPDDTGSREEHLSAAGTEKKPPKQTGRIFIIIDDVGYNTTQLEPFLELPYPIIFSILPGLSHTREAAEKIAATGKEIMLHLPLEAKNGRNPGPGAVYAQMEKQEIETIVRQHFDELPEAAAVNNHMGSLITENSSIMETILSIVKERNVVYIDSLTTPESVVPAVSEKLSIPYYSRDIFLDNRKDRASIIEALREGIETASIEGKAVLIGHVGSAELAEAILDSSALMEKYGVEIARLEDLKQPIPIGKEKSHEHSWN